MPKQKRITIKFDSKTGSVISRTEDTVEVPDITPEEYKFQVRLRDAQETPEYRLLCEMIDELYEAGVDVSYFPDSATDVLIRYAKYLKGRSKEEMQILDDMKKTGDQMLEVIKEM